MFLQMIRLNLLFKDEYDFIVYMSRYLEMPNMSLCLAYCEAFCGQQGLILLL